EVTINKKTSQSDPTNQLPIEFDVVFSKTMNATTFTVEDITQNGDATGITWEIVDSGDQTNFTLKATAVTSGGTLIPSLAAGVVSDSVGGLNDASSSTDNQV